MPIIKIEYDSTSFNEQSIRDLGVELQNTVGDASTRERKDVSVFAYANQITVNAAPMEIFVELSAAAIPDGDKRKMLDTVVKTVRRFKLSHKIDAAINVSVVQMDWEFRIGV